MMSECPICYECECECCDFTCGHSFCYRCVKTWYQKGTETCPLCRAEMCFFGMRELKRAWDDEMREDVLTYVVESVFKELEPNIVLGALKYVYERYNTLMEMYPDTRHEIIGFILMSPHIKFDAIVIRVMDDIPTYMKNLMIPKTSYGVKMSRRH